MAIDTQINYRSTSGADAVANARNSKNAQKQEMQLQLEEH